MNMNSAFWQELETLAEAAAQAVAPALLGAYLNKTTGVSGAPAITLNNVGRIAGTVAAATVLQHLVATQQAAAVELQTAPLTPVAVPAPSPAADPTGQSAVAAAPAPAPAAHPAN